MSDNRFLNEVDFHNKRYAEDAARKNQEPFYQALKPLYECYKSKIVQNTKNGLNVLEIGCGVGDDVPEKIYHSHYVGVDCSDVAIAKCKEKFTSNNYKFVVGDALRLPYPDQYFDFVYAVGVLHHLDFSAALAEIKRVVKANNVMFVEPLASNPIINLYRKLTPDARSPDEKPLSHEKLKLIKKYFPSIKFKYFGFLTIAGVFFKSERVYNFLYLMDCYILKIPFVKKMFWSVVILDE